MLEPSISLKRALRTHLLSQTQLVALLGGNHVFDVPPRGQQMPYVVFSNLRARDFSTATEQGTEHALELSIYTDTQSTEQALELSQHLHSALHDVSLSLQDHALVSLRHLETQIVKASEPDAHTRAVLKWRAVTEAI